MKDKIKEIKLEKRKPTFDYILNDLALSSLLIKCVHSDSASYQEKFDLQYQIKLMQKEISKLRRNIYNALEYIEKTMRIDDEYPDYMEMETCEYQELLNILKGDKDE